MDFDYRQCLTLYPIFNGILKKYNLYAEEGDSNGEWLKLSICDKETDKEVTELRRFWTHELSFDYDEEENKIYEYLEEKIDKDLLKNFRNDFNDFVSSIKRLSYQ